MLGSRLHSRPRHLKNLPIWFVKQGPVVKNFAQGSLCGWNQCKTYKINQWLVALKFSSKKIDSLTAGLETTSNGEFRRYSRHNHSILSTKIDIHDHYKEWGWWLSLFFFVHFLNDGLLWMLGICILNIMTIWTEQFVFLTRNVNHRELNIWLWCHFIPLIFHSKEYPLETTDYLQSSYRKHSEIVMAKMGR